MVGSFTWEEPWINIYNFRITNKSAFNGMLYVAQNGSHCILSNNVFDANFNSAITPIVKWNGADAQPFGTAGSFNTIISNQFWNTRAEMLFRTYGDSNLITGNFCANLDFTDCKQIFGRTNVFIGNTFSNLFFSGLNENHADCFQMFGSAGGSSFGSKDHLVEGNLYIGGASLTNTESLWQVGNLTDDGNTECKNLTVRNNVFIGISAKCSATMPGVLFYNNIFVRCSTNSENGGAVLIYGSNAVGNATGGRVYNNIAIDCGLAGATNTGLTYFDPVLVNVKSDYNYVIKNGGAVQIDPTHRAVGDGGGWDTTDWWEPNGINGPVKNVAGSSSTITADPKFINASQDDYRLLTGSPMISAGLNLTNFTTDFRGLARDTWEIGPYEFQASDSDPGLVCWVGPRTIRAYPVVSSGQIQIVVPGNALRTGLWIDRRVFTNKPSAWQTWTNISADITFPGVTNATTYTDAVIQNGVHYEYQIRQQVTNYVCSDLPDHGFRDYQYIDAGYQAPLTDTRGNVVLLTESGVASSLTTELTRLEADLRGDGYKVFRHDVAAVEVTAGGWPAAVTATKALVSTDYATDTSADWYLFIVGHVPIPYSGTNSPGSHNENLGAHPADSFYADMTGTWTDVTANTASNIPQPDFTAQQNTPGDGKFDQNFIPAIPTMRVGRVDLRNMPAFGKTEVQLLQQYLDRNHAWRHKEFTVRNRALVYGETTPVLLNADKPIEAHDLAASIFGNVNSMDRGTWLDYAADPETSYLTAMKQGSGGYDHDNQLGTIEDFAASALYVAFPSMVGSYYGDFDSAIITNSFAQMPLASEGYAVATYYHANDIPINSSAMGEPIGNDLFAMGANYFKIGAGTYYTPYVRIVPPSTESLVVEQQEQYITLLGDPTLRIRVVAPPTVVAVNASGADNIVSWTAADDTGIVGYHVYRATTGSLNAFTRLTSSPTTSPYTDTGASSSSYTYMVRTVKLDDSPNRSFYDASEGIVATESAPGPTPSGSRGFTQGNVLLSGSAKLE